MNRIDYKTLYFDPEDTQQDVEATSGGGSAANTEQTQAQKQPKTANTEPTPAQDDRNTPRYSDADLDKIISKKFAKWQREQAAAVDEATKLANMTAQERAEHERDAFKTELDSLKRTIAIADMERTARGILQNDGVNVPDSIISTIIGDDADETNANVKAFSKAFKAAVQDEVKRQLSHKTPTSGAHGTMTKSDIDKIADPLKRQQAIRENMSLYKTNRR